MGYSLGGGSGRFCFFEGGGGVNEIFQGRKGEGGGGICPYSKQALPPQVLLVLQQQLVLWLTLRAIAINCSRGLRYLLYV